MILPAAVRYLGQLYAVGPASRAVEALSVRVGELIDRLSDAIDTLEHAQHEAHDAGSVQEEAQAFVAHVIPMSSTPGPQAGRFALVALLLPSVRTIVRPHAGKP